MNGQCHCATDAVAIKVYASCVIGTVKPVNGVGQPPLLTQVNHDMFHFLAEAGIPFSRLHDVNGPYGGFVFVDIPNVFRDFDADESDPASYDFDFTDHLIAGLVAHGVKPFYRLGVTIENYVSVKAYRVYPPKDFAKWARVCEHVVAHYNEGWADGFRYGIDHWEIWNEPDLGEKMWKGSFAEYIDLYVTASKLLKRRFPAIKVGGFASCGFQALTGDDGELPRYSLKCIREFLGAVKAQDAPLDFFSFHSYSNLDKVLAEIAAGRELLDAAGFPGIEMCLDEWLTVKDPPVREPMPHAATIAASLVEFQASTLDSAAIYDARCTFGSYSPLFDGPTRSPRKAYYAFKAFNELRKIGTAVAAASSNPQVHVAAAARDGKVAVMIVNATGERVPFTLDACGAPSTCFVTDGDNDFQPCELPRELPPYGILAVVCGGEASQVVAR